MNRRFLVLPAAFLLVLVSCSVPAAKSGTTDSGKMRTDFTAKFIEETELLYPIWWVEEGYVTSGGSPYVVVLTKEGKIYARTNQNETLKESGTWSYDEQSREVKMPDNGNIKLGVDSSGHWNNFMDFNGVKLVKGTADYNKSVLLSLWTVSNAEYTLNGNKLTGYASFFLAKDGKVNLGCGPNILRSRWAAEDPYGKTEVTWKVSELGDRIDVSSGVLSLYFKGTQRMAKINYPKSAHAATEDTSEKELYTDTGSTLQAEGVSVSR